MKLELFLQRRLIKFPGVVSHHHERSPAGVASDGREESKVTSTSLLLSLRLLRLVLYEYEYNVYNIFPMNSCDKNHVLIYESEY